MPGPKDDVLRAHVQARDYRAIEKLLAAGTGVTDAGLEDIARALMEVEFGRVTLTAGWWPLGKRMLPRSRTLSENAYAILGGGLAVADTDAYQKTDRSNLLHAIAPLDLTADELPVLRRLRDRISQPTCREDVYAEEDVVFLVEKFRPPLRNPIGLPHSAARPLGHFLRPAPHNGSRDL